MKRMHSKHLLYTVTKVKANMFADKAIYPLATIHSKFSTQDMKIIQHLTRSKTYASLTNQT